MLNGLVSLFIFTLKEQNKCFINWLRAGPAIHQHRKQVGRICCSLLCICWINLKPKVKSKVVERKGITIFEP
jgi:hypothetical protein